MVPEGQTQDGEKAIWRFQVRLWTGAGICIALLSFCFIGNCVVTYHLTCARLSNVTFKEMTGVTGVTKVMGVTGREGNFSCCPTGWKPFGSSCYFISNAPKTQPESEENCLVMEAHLLVITSEEEQNFIIQNLDTAFLYCIGLTETLKPSDPSGKRHWQWVDQTPYNESATFWHKNEPGHNNKHCVVLHSHTITNKWGWVSVECLLPYRSICEMTKISCSVEQSP